MNKESRPHDHNFIELLREDPSFADEHLSAALEEAEEPGGGKALLAALRHIAEVQGIAVIAERDGIKSESLYCAPYTKGNPTIKTLLPVMGTCDGY